MINYKSATKNWVYFFIGRHQGDPSVRLPRPGQTAGAIAAEHPAGASVAVHLLRTAQHDQSLSGQQSDPPHREVRLRRHLLHPLAGPHQQPDRPHRFRRLFRFSSAFTVLVFKINEMEMPQFTFILVCAVNVFKSFLFFFLFFFILMGNIFMKLNHS